MEPEFFDSNWFIGKGGTDVFATGIGLNAFEPEKFTDYCNCLGD